jgi:molecular chaperone DnaJ
MGVGMDNYYEILDVDAAAEKEEIRKAFRRLAKMYHPDVSRDQCDFIRILDAYKTLIDDMKRRRYNLKLGGAAPSAVLPKSRVSYAVSLKDVALFRTLGPKTTVRKKGKRTLSGYDVCVRLSFKELLSGSAVRIDVPAHVVCPICGGSRKSCSFCQDRGHITKAIPVTFGLPKHLQDGDVFRVPLRGIKQKVYAFFTVSELLVRVELYKTY